MADMPISKYWTSDMMAFVGPGVRTEQKLPDIMINLHLRCQSKVFEAMKTNSCRIDPCLISSIAVMQVSPTWQMLRLQQ
jgi:hypothetical protein